MENVMEVARWVHAGIGVVCLVSGAMALLSKKGAGRHPFSGRIFVASLSLLFVAILFNIVVQKNVFMLGIGWLAVYAGIDGWRSLRRFKGLLEPEPQPLDKVLIGLCFLFALMLGGFGVRVLLASGNMMGVVCIAFAALGLGLARGSVQRLRGPASRKVWMKAHIGLMSGAFSAALTAFLAIQLSGRIGSWEWVVWVAPGVLMMGWARRQEKQRGLAGSSEA